jgi:uncharacterized protein (TIGR00299 family) protein
LNIAYLDCFAGAGGDMLLGALIDIGLPLSELTSELCKLPLTGYELRAAKAQCGPLTGTKVTVALAEAQEAEHRSLSQILDIIAASDLPQPVKGQGARIFSRLAEAEAKVHGITVEEVHFHEVGAVDAIVDVMGVVLGFHLLGVEAVFASVLPLGYGSIDTAHGNLPLPAPATLELLAMSGAPVRPEAEAGELVTPTAAAIITTLASFHCPPFTLERIGYGVGARHVLRLWLGQTTEVTTPELLLLQTNIDDMNPELYGYVMERLFAQGALDVWFIPIQMKKNRPAVTLCVLTSAQAEGALIETILRETPTLGVRVQAIGRRQAEREVVEIETSLGRAAVKLKRLHGSPVAVVPEYEDCRRLALEHRLPLQEVYRIVSSAADALFLPSRP